jgi:protein gp37
MAHPCGHDIVSGQCNDCLAARLAHETARLEALHREERRLSRHESDVHVVEEDS